MNIAELERNAWKAARLLRAMGNERRLMILCQLEAGEKTVGELAALVGLSQSALSQHLARLRADGLVATRRTARTIHYSLASTDVEALIGVLSGLYCVPAPGSADDTP
ncbi:ArsR/SmtB family transcription factor [Azospirillum halopraeferens]|uniref:ArsR/SmtB family transcription factor n=1 Tax=Azospirillum halopraeferens TaxID=34010 RepID=UPI00048CCAA8|nr:metalloregulator ArsR/SmtB family transcription factor [Azospirillum halopraeferens]